MTSDEHEVHCMLSQSLQVVLDTHQAVFHEGLGGFYIKPSTKPSVFILGQYHMLYKIKLKMID